MCFVGRALPLLACVGSGFNSQHLKLKTNSQLKSLESNKDDLDSPPRPDSFEHTAVRRRCRVPLDKASWTTVAQHRHS